MTTLPAARAILSTEPEWLDVKGVTYRKHEKPGSPPSLRVDYRTGLNSYREWICLEHTGYARTKAESWWLRRASAPVPGSVDAALERLQELNEPTHIRIRTKGNRETAREIAMPKGLPYLKGFVLYFSLQAQTA